MPTPTPTEILYGVAAIVLVTILFKIFKCFWGTLIVIGEGNVCVVERLGKFNRILQPGMHLTLPFVESCRTVKWTHTVEDTFAKRSRQEIIHTHLITTQEILYDFPEIKVSTKDRLTVELNGILFFKIVDPVKAVYSITDLYQAIEQLCVTSVRDIISSMTLDDAIKGKLVTQESVLKEFGSAAESWGVKITRFDIQSLTPNQEVLAGIEKLARVQREAQAQLETDTVKNKIAVQKAETEMLLKQREAETEALIKRKQAESVAFEIESRANAEKIRLEKILSVNGITQDFLIQSEYTKAWQAITQMNNNNKVIIIPMESAKFFGASSLNNLD